MKQKDFELDCIVFVCTNRRKEGETACGESGGQELRDELKDLVKRDPVLGQKKIRVSQSGCLGRCQEGVAVLAMPQGQWFLEAGSQSSKEILVSLQNAIGDFD